MKKFNMMLVLMLVLAAVILLGGCAQSGPGSSDSVSAAEAEPSSAFGSETSEEEAGVINVFVPSTMTLSMNDLIEAYRSEGAGRVVANYSDSESLSRQIRENADCDIFICDDPAVLDQLDQEGYLQPETRTAFSDREIVLTTHAQEEGHANVEAFYEFLLSDQAQQIMNESFDSMAAESTDSGVSSESAPAVS